ncbi:MAG: aldehyde dehydrogenase family protein [Rhodospirillaceae bacterium]|nr:MAG: aldehyde dehydrogenase family protein [Rhodospirillaceae bacterium]
MHSAKAIRPLSETDTPDRPAYVPLQPIHFIDVDKQAHALADRIENRFGELSEILLTYESYEVVRDETDRTLDLLRSLRENERFFQIRVGSVATFLPRNQPLYAFACFVIVPSLMASQTCFRIPHTMRHFFDDMLNLLDTHELFPNVIVSRQGRIEFLREVSARRIDPATRAAVPVTDAVIFTGTPAHADQLRSVFDQRTLFIANGAGHNPVVIGEDADVAAAVDAIMALQFYNQGQDCAAPNAILVHKASASAVSRLLYDRIRSLRVGPYRDKACRIGPISDAKDLVRIQDIFISHRPWIDSRTPGIINAHEAIVEPTVIAKPLRDGGNFIEAFAPIVFLQEYESDADLSLYFEHPQYARNAMYISLYGSSAYVDALIDRPIRGTVLHDDESVLRNMHLHSPGVERGTRPYGGRGVGASSLSLGGRTLCRPTLPQHDIWERVAQPLFSETTRSTYRQGLEYSAISYRTDIEKLLRLKSSKVPETPAVSKKGAVYIDSRTIESDGPRYVQVAHKNIHRLLQAPNAEHIATLTFRDRELIRTVRTFLLRPSKVAVEEFRDWLYALAKETGATLQDNRADQRRLFGNLYQLLLGEEAGPRLPEFLSALDREYLANLLDV